MDDQLVDVADWLRQGDLFSDVPCPSPVWSQDMMLSWEIVNVPALLISHGCDIDKPRTKSLTFCVARSIETLADENSKMLARRDQVQPYDSFRIGKPSSGGEYICRFADIFWLPVNLFGTSTFEPVGDDEPRVVSNATRLGTIPAERVALLHAKLVGYWTRQVATPLEQ